MQRSAGLNAVDRLDGRAPAIQALRTQIRRLAAFDAVGGAMVPTLLLQGETGTGKGLVARIVHDGGPRAAGPFIPVNCAAIPETMLEAELFGFDAGAFTDARHSKPGLFEAASGGTLFLDEIDALSLTLQSKLLTAIEEKRIRRLGAITAHDVDVKLVAATQQDLGQLAAEGRFRADLYHRLAVVVLALPPLRERGDDVLLLAQSMLERFAVAYDTGAKRLTRDAEAWLRRYPWPGNVRELGHADRARDAASSGRGYRRPSAGGARAAGQGVGLDGLRCRPLGGRVRAESRSRRCRKGVGSDRGFRNARRSLEGSRGVGAHRGQCPEGGPAPRCDARHASLSYAPLWHRAAGRRGPHRSWIRATICPQGSPGARRPPRPPRSRRRHRAKRSVLFPGSERACSPGNISPRPSSPSSSRGVTRRRTRCRATSRGRRRHAGSARSTRSWPGWVVFPYSEARPFRYGGSACRSRWTRCPSVRSTVRSRSGISLEA